MYRFTFLAVILLTAGCQQQQKAVMTDASEQSTREITNRYVEIFNTNDTGMIAALIDSSFVCYHPAYPDNIVGRAGFRAWLEVNHNAFPDLKLVEDEVIIKGDRAFVRWTFTGTQTGSLREVPATGKTMRLTGLSFIRIAGDKIIEERLGMDMLDAYRQLGFTLTPPEG
jgi:steroid delta-isomerase-like uncharacterized protein